MKRAIKTFQVELEEFEADECEGYVKFHIDCGSRKQFFYIKNHVKTIGWFKKLSPKDVIVFTDSRYTGKRFDFCNEIENDYRVEMIND